jgi:hypothetical protein
MCQFKRIMHFKKWKCSSIAPRTSILSSLHVSLTGVFHECMRTYQQAVHECARAPEDVCVIGKSSRQPCTGKPQCLLILGGIRFGLAGAGMEAWKGRRPGPPRLLHSLKVAALGADRTGQGRVGLQLLGA